MCVCVYYVCVYGCVYTYMLVYGAGGGLQNGKIAGPKLFAPPLKTG